MLLSQWRNIQRNNKTMNRIFNILVLFNLMPMLLFASKGVADDAYLSKQYDLAIQKYEKIVAENPSSTVFFNLGNAYCHQRDTIKAILNYERALYLDPSNDDAKYNLSLCKEKMGVIEDGLSDMYIFDKFADFIYRYSASCWAWIGFFTAIFFVIIYFIRRFVKHPLVSKFCWGLGGLSILGFVVFNIISIWVFVSQDKSEKYVLMQDTYLYVNPSKSSKVINEIVAGTTFLLVENTNSGWMQIELSNESIGWVFADVESVTPMLPVENR